MLIKEFSDKYNISTDTIRFYEKIGIIHPKRLENGYRLFDEECERIIQLIIVLKQLDFSLDEIKFLLSLEKQPISSECNDISSKMFQEKIIHIENKILFLQMARQQLYKVKELIENNQYMYNYHKIQELATLMYKQLTKGGKKRNDTENLDTP
ncbi:hypothetical protein DW1_2774 [Proteiniborus sp. DW1]|uniref:MerR family transcriptional regulator n=1 Tax=Proteiniborus sp. DW1 TaxID=1889883 RepID=UPI00092E0EFF|nr:MerR family transcriptional regulator [Proteiniborus sp. DW1]SCG84334.1 hypothetical protein DW1_2774 [Proteiniborus sp. DW1]